MQVRTIEADTLYILGDLHMDAPTFDKALYEKAKDIVKDAPVVVMGDVLDWGFFDDLRSQLKVHAIAEGLTRQELLEAMEIEMLERLQMLFNDFPGIVMVCEGNHDARIVKRAGVNFLRFLAKKHDALYTEGQGVLRVKGEKPYNLLFTHGARGGRRQSAPLNELTDILQGWENIDAVIIGHHHKYVNSVVSRAVITDEGVQYKQVRLISTPAFMGWEVYAQKRGYTPPYHALIKLTFDGSLAVTEVGL